MSHTYKQIEIVGSSTTTMEDAVNSAIAKASETIRNIQWFEVIFYLSVKFIQYK